MSDMTFFLSTFRRSRGPHDYLRFNNIKFNVPGLQLRVQEQSKILILLKWLRLTMDIFLTYILSGSKQQPKECLQARNKRAEECFWVLMKKEGHNERTLLRAIPGILEFLSLYCREYY